jgi:hypothetical protein
MQLVACFKALCEYDKGLDDCAAQFIRARHHRRFGHGRMLDQRALDFEGTDTVTGRGDDIVGATGKPEITVFVAPAAIASDVPVPAH